MARRAKFILPLVLTLAAAILCVRAQQTGFVKWSKENGDYAFLCYAHLSNRLQYVRSGNAEEIKIGSAGSLTHHADPALSPSGDQIAFVRPGPQDKREEIVTYNLQTHAMQTLTTWRGSVWGLAWSPTRSEIALVADRPLEDTSSLFVIDTSTHKVEDLTSQVKWVATHSRPSWSRSGDQIAVQQMFTTSENSDEYSILVVERDTRAARRIAEGRFPAWLPNADRLAYVSVDGKRCYTVAPTGDDQNLLFTFKDIQGQEILGAVVWSPAADKLLFNTTTGLEGDGRAIHLYDVRSGHTQDLGFDRSFEVLAWVRAKDPTH